MKYAILENNKQYQELVKKVLSTIEDIKAEGKRGVRREILDANHRTALQALSRQIKEHMTEEYDKANEVLKASRYELEAPKYEDPSVELLRRQDVATRLELYTPEQLQDYLDNVDATQVDIFTIGELEKQVRAKLVDTSLERASGQLEALKNAVMFNNEAHAEAQENFNLLHQLPMRRDGSLFVYNEDTQEYDYIVIDNLLNETLQAIEAEQKRAIKR